MLTTQWDLFDLLFKDVLDRESTFSPITTTTKLHYPIDVKSIDNGIQFDVAIAGAEKKDIVIETEDDMLKISYIHKDNTEKYLYRGITKKSFNFNWKLGGKFDTGLIEATMDKGLLTIKIPYTKNIAKKRVEIV